ncbi:FkbM family methyltransferase [Candidatus Pelagibacter sp. Uisw_127]|uniref:FkbM family methyltransferase n=1 Tax=Candidatus Pelagibacter sp. Uisw_127 TaxID=3230988 RepID=UPI0039ECCBFD
MKSVVKPILKKIINFFFKYLRKENYKIKKIIYNFEIDLDILDIGATGGIQKKWYLIKKILNVSLVDAYENSIFGNNKFKSLNIISKLFSSVADKNIKFNIAKYPLCSSVSEPNFDHINRYKGKINFFNAESFKTTKQIEMETETIDRSFFDKNLDFIKIDAEGHHYEILEGATNTLEGVLGLEIECEFFQIRKNQKVFSDVVKLMEKQNFEFIDFLNIHKWERDQFRFTGQPQHSDILFLRRPEDIVKKFNRNEISENVVLKYITIISIYNRADLLKFINSFLNDHVINKYNLKQLHKLIEAKVKRLNRILQIKELSEESVNNEI